MEILNGEIVDRKEPKYAIPDMTTYQLWYWEWDESVWECTSEFNTLHDVRNAVANEFGDHDCVRVVKIHLPGVGK